jgi:hypothetical protein
MTIEYKQCSKCKEVKSVSEFHKNRKIKSGYASACKPCVASYTKEFYHNNLEHHKLKARAGNLKRKYGLTNEEYDALFLFQGGVCFICKRACPTGRRLAVDHDHDTGAIRGLLCTMCNQRVVGNLNKTQVAMMWAYMNNPPADFAFGGVRYVPEGMEKPRKRRKRRTIKRTGTRISRGGISP